MQGHEPNRVPDSSPDNTPT